MPETVVESCPETGEDKMSQFDLDLRPRNKEGTLVIVKNELGTSGQPKLDARDCGGQLPRYW